jgi:hypothetical protein
VASPIDIQAYWQSGQRKDALSTGNSQFIEFIEKLLETLNVLVIPDNQKFEEMMASQLIPVSANSNDAISKFLEAKSATFNESARVAHTIFFFKIFNCFCLGRTSLNVQDTRKSTLVNSVPTAKPMMSIHNSRGRSGRAGLGFASEYACLADMSG